MSREPARAPPAGGWGGKLLTSQRSHCVACRPQQTTLPMKLQEWSFCVPSVDRQEYAQKKQVFCLQRAAQRCRRVRSQLYYQHRRAKHKERKRDEHKPAKPQDNFHLQLRHRPTVIDKTSKKRLSQRTCPNPQTQLHTSVPCISRTCRTRALSFRPILYQLCVPFRPCACHDIALRVPRIPNTQ